MKVPEPLVKFLRSKRITMPTPIQLQGIPTACAISYVSTYPIPDIDLTVSQGVI